MNHLFDSELFRIAVLLYTCVVWMWTDLQIILFVEIVMVKLEGL